MSACEIRYSPGLGSAIVMVSPPKSDFCTLSFQRPMYGESAAMRHVHVTQAAATRQANALKMRISFLRCGWRRDHIHEQTTRCNVLRPSTFGCSTSRASPELKLRLHIRQHWHRAAPPKRASRQAELGNSHRFLAWNIRCGFEVSD